MWRPRRETRPSWRRGKPVKTRAGASRASAGASAVFPGLCRPRENARGGSAGDHVCAAPDRGHLGQDRYGDFLRSDGADLHADRGVDPPETLPGNPFLGELRKNAAHLSGRPDQTDVFRGGRRVGKPRAQSRQVGLPATRHKRHVTVAPRPQRLGRKLVEPVRLKYGRIPGEALAPRVLFAVIRHGDFVAEFDRHPRQSEAHVSAPQDQERGRGLEQLDVHARRATADHVGRFAFLSGPDLAVEKVVPLDQAFRSLLSEESAGVGHDESLEGSSSDRAGEASVLEDQESPADPRRPRPLCLDDRRQGKLPSHLELFSQVAEELVVGHELLILPRDSEDGFKFQVSSFKRLPGAFLKPETSGLSSRIPPPWPLSASPSSPPRDWEPDSCRPRRRSPRRCCRWSIGLWCNTSSRRPAPRASSASSSSPAAAKMRSRTTSILPSSSSGCSRKEEREICSGRCARSRSWLGSPTSGRSPLSASGTPSSRPGTSSETSPSRSCSGTTSWTRRSPASAR